MFFGYTLFVVMRIPLLMAVRAYIGSESAVYFIAYCVTMIGDTAFAFFVIKEAYAHTLYRYEGLLALSTAIFRWTLMLLVFLAVFAAFDVPVADTNHLWAAVTMVDCDTMMVESALIVLLFAFAKTHSLKWSECIFGIAAGVGLLCSLDLAALTLHAPYGEALAFTYAIFKSTFCVCALVFWAFHLYRSERLRSNETQRLRSDALDELNAAVLQYLKR